MSDNKVQQEDVAKALSALRALSKGHESRGTSTTEVPAMEGESVQRRFTTHRTTLILAVGAALQLKRFRRTVLQTALKKMERTIVAVA